MDYNYNLKLDTSIFISYSVEDDFYRKELEKHLQPLKRQGILSYWSDRDISAGALWDDEIIREIEKADIILLLISPDYLASDYCFDNQMIRAIEKSKKQEFSFVVSVLLRPCSWKDTPLTNLPVFPKNKIPISNWTKTDDAFIDVIENIKILLDILRGTLFFSEGLKAYANTSYQEAIEWLSKTITFIGKDRLHNVYGLRALIYNQLGMFEEAIQDTDAAFRILSENTEEASLPDSDTQSIASAIMHTRAEAFCIASNQLPIDKYYLDEGMKIVNLILEHEPDSEKGLEFKATLLERSQKEIECLSVIDRILKINPENFFALNKAMTIHFTKYDKLKALEYAKRAKQVSNGNEKELAFIGAVLQIEKIIQKTENEKKRGWFSWLTGK